MLKGNKIMKDIAIERIERLFSLAKDRTVLGDAESKRLAKRYVGMAKRISTHYRVPLPKMVKNSVCKKCGAVLIAGLNCSVRVASSKRYMVYKCLECGEEKHIFYK